MIVWIDELCGYLDKLQLIQYSKMKSNNENLKTIIESVYSNDENKKFEIIKYNIGKYIKENNLEELTDNDKVKIFKNLGYEDGEIEIILDKIGD